MCKKILFLNSGYDAFIKLDCELLSDSYEVIDFKVANKFPANFLKYWSLIKDADVLFCWFASWNSFWALLLARIFRKPSVLVIGGYDLANLPEANYGHQRGGMGKYISRFAMNLATILFTNSLFSQKEAEVNAGVPVNKVKVIYHGVPDTYRSDVNLARNKIALTVGKVEWSNLKRKGLESFVQAAALLPDVQFILVGAFADDSIEFLRSIATINVNFTGRVGDEELRNYYQGASVYVQASMHEGFGISVAEAMLAGCIPVVTHNGSLPEVVGNCGLYCESNSPENIAESIRAGLNSSDNLRILARERVLREFSMERRQLALENIIQNIEL